MFDLNGTLVIFVFSFLVFMALLNEVMLKPVGKVIEKRAAKIKADIEAGKAARIEAEELLDSYQQHLHMVKAKAQSLINESTEKATYHRHLEIDRIREDGRQKLDQAKAEIDREKIGLMDDLVAKEMDLVNDLAEKVVGQKVDLKLDPARVRRVLEDAS